MGAGLAVVGLLVCLATVAVAVFRLPFAVLAVVVVLAVVGVLLGGFLLTRAGYVVRLGEEGYQVRFVRGAGVKQARWRDVDDAVTAEVAGAQCVVLRLKDGRTTTIPVAVLAVDRDVFVRDVREHLQDGHGLRRLG
jgi:hypothetical protein